LAISEWIVCSENLGFPLLPEHVCYLGNRLGHHPDRTRVTLSAQCVAVIFPDYPTAGTRAKKRLPGLSQTTVNSSLASGTA